MKDNLLFFKPANHLAYYFISRFIYEKNSNEANYPTIYVVLKHVQFKKINIVWKERIDEYDLNHYYFYGSKGLVLIDENDFKRKKVKNHILKNVKQIHYILNDDVSVIPCECGGNDVSSDIHSLNRLIGKKNKKNIKIIFGVPSIYRTKNTILNDYFENNIRHSSGIIYYYNPYLGESKRGILNNHSKIKLFFHLIKEFYLFKKYTDEYNFLCLDSLESIYSLFKEHFILNIDSCPGNEFLFNNRGSLSLYCKDFTDDLDTTKLSLDYSDLLTFQKHYHDTLYSLHCTHNIIKIDYKTNIDITPFIIRHDYHSNNKLMPAKSLNLFSGIVAFISLNIIIILSILIVIYIFYFKRGVGFGFGFNGRLKEYQNYIILVILIVAYKIPNIVCVSSLLKESLLSVFQFFAGHIIFDKDDKDDKDNKDNNKYIFTWNPHHIVPLGSFLSILSNQFENKYNTTITNVCHEFLTYFPFSSILLDLLGFKSCSKNNISNELNKNNSIGIWIGGRSEMLKSEEHRDILYLTKRKGIFELSIRHQTTLIPTFTFGDNNIYLTDLFDGGWDYGRKFVIPTFGGIYKELIKFVQIFREKPEYLTVVGEPVLPPFYKNENENSDIPNELIEELKSRYIKSLMYLYEKYKNCRYDVNKKLVVI